MATANNQRHHDKNGGGPRKNHRSARLAAALFGLAVPLLALWPRGASAQSPVRPEIARALASEIRQVAPPTIPDRAYNPEAAARSRPPLALPGEGLEDIGKLASRNSEAQPFAFSERPTELEVRQARVFGEPLAPLSEADPGTPQGADGSPAGPEEAALAQALKAFAQRKSRDDFGPFEGFLAKHPESRWNASLLTNVGLARRQAGWFEKAGEDWETAWRLCLDNASRGGEIGRAHV